jgi:hypothetical protein
MSKLSECRAHPTRCRSVLSLWNDFDRTMIVTVVAVRMM